MPVSGDQSFEALALPHLETIYRVARRLARNEHEAEDLVQETYLKAQQAFSRYELREFGIKPWLLKILHNSFLNQRSRQKKAPRATDQATLEQAPSENESELPPALDYENLDQEVKQAIERIAPEFREVLLLWATTEVSYEEIGKIMDIPVGTVMSRLHRARRQLTSRLEGFARQNRLLGERK